MESEAAPQPDLVSRISPITIARLSVVVLVVGMVVCLALFALLGRSLDGVVRLVVLGVVAPVVMVIALMLWQAIRSIRLLGGQRVRTLSDLRERRIVGVLAYPAIAGWHDRLQRDFALPTFPHLLVASPETIDSERGQHAMAVLGDLIGRPPPPGGAYTLPGRATLALVNAGDIPAGKVSIWDLSSLIERVDAGDAAAGEELYELQLYLQQRATEAVSAASNASG